MKQTFEVLNVKCGGCASTLTKSLKDEFGEVSVDLEVILEKLHLILKIKNLML
jgi:copper chaperone